jgi:hypothetical protein
MNIQLNRNSNPSPTSIVPGSVVITPANPPTADVGKTKKRGKPPASARESRSRERRGSAVG